MDTADSICRFFSNFPKRQLVFERCIEQKLEGECRSKLKSICKTRWVERHEAFEVFIDLFVPHICCLEDIKGSTDWNRESRSDAQSLLLALTHFPFIVALVIAEDVLAYTKALSVKLQGRYVDVVSAYNQISFEHYSLRGMTFMLGYTRLHLQWLVLMNLSLEFQVSNSTMPMYLPQIHLSIIKDHSHP